MQKVILKLFAKKKKVILKLKCNLVYMRGIKTRKKKKKTTFINNITCMNLFLSAQLKRK